ncbi:VanZ family protein [Paracoccus fontiphilus]|uniref:VanZ family protein n=1 Tax=Paracoccus fontiphilus TaxID=1815556 RepID=A0ABV7IKE6_9RHOB
MPTQSKLAIGLSLLVAAVISVLTLTPISAPPLGPISHSDKIYHALAFAGLALPLSFFRPGWLFVTVSVYAGFGGIIEILQPFVEREGDIADWIADLMGIGIGVLAGRVAARGATSVAALLRKPHLGQAQ